MWSRRAYMQVYTHTHENSYAHTTMHNNDFDVTPLLSLQNATPGGSVDGQDCDGVDHSVTHARLRWWWSGCQCRCWRCCSCRCRYQWSGCQSSCRYRCRSSCQSPPPHFPCLLGSPSEIWESYDFKYPLPSWWGYPFNKHSLYELPASNQTPLTSPLASPGPFHNPQNPSPSVMNYVQKLGPDCQPLCQHRCNKETHLSQDQWSTWNCNNCRP